MLGLLGHALLQRPNCSPVPKSRAARPWLGRTQLAQEPPMGTGLLLPPALQLWALGEFGSDSGGE